jgi:hypothetical protein
MSQEHEQETARLISVLRRTARMAQQANWMGSEADTAAFCVTQYNRVLARLTELDPGVGPVFQPLPADTSLMVTAMACRQLVAYFAGEGEAVGSGWGQVYGAAIDSEAFKSFWERCATDIEDLGTFIRESVEAWARQKQAPHPKSGTDPRQEAGT